MSVPSRNIKNPCGICSKSVGSKHRAIQCNYCNSWIHIKCQHLDAKDYQLHQNNPELEFVCLPCNSSIIPFCNLNDNHFDILVNKGVNFKDDDVIDLAITGNQKLLFDQLNKAIYNSMPNLDPIDDNTDTPPLNCQYYSTDEFINQKFKSEKSFSVFHLNIHSIALHIEELKTTLQLLDFKFDFICISESKITSDQPQTTVDISLDGYQSPLSTPTESTKGGVLLYAKTGLNVIPRQDISNKIYKSKEIESVFVELLNPSEPNTIIGTIYRHPCMDEKVFNDKYVTILKNFREKEQNKNFYITGDYNFDLLKTETHPETSNFFDAMMSSYLLPTIILPTRINHKNNTVIDNIFTNHYHPDMTTGNLLLGISDHLPSFLVVPKANQNHTPKKHNIFKRDTKNFDRENFILDFLDIDWSSSLEADKKDVNHSFKIFFDKINELLDRYAPLKKVTQKQFKQRLKPWVTDKILDKIALKNNFLKRYTLCKNMEQKNTLYCQFKKLKNEITDLTRRGKKEFYKNYFADNKNNLKKVWKGIKEIVNIKSKNFDQPSCVQNGSMMATDPTDISNSFNKYFTSIADDILRKRKFEGNNSHLDYLPPPLQNSIALHLCDEIEIKTIIASIDTCKSYGPNSIPTEFLHLLKDEISGPLSILFNLSFTTGTFPDMLKIAKTIPIFKKGSKLLVSNYRPISLLSNINKILEKLMYSRIYDFLTKFNILYDLQFGFRSKHSTSHALINIIEKINKSLDSKKSVCGLFVDFQKAFDTVNHSILLDKLYNYGIRGPAHDWFKSYLSNRTQFVSILGFQSTTHPQPHGVPQGSVLGPLLFLIYINDLNRAIKYSRVYHFADDTNLLNISNSPKQMQKRVNIDLKLLYRWLLANKISLNCSKTELIIFPRRGGNPTNFQFRIKLNGFRILPSDYIKYLGVYIDTNLTGKYHCKFLHPKLSRACGMLSKARHYIPEKELISLYYAIFSSHLTYGCQAWSQNLSPQLDKIITLQKRAIRTIKFAEFDAPSSPLFKELKVLKIQDFVTLQNCLFVHDFLNNTLPDCFQNLFQPLDESHGISTKASDLGCLYIPSCRTTKFGLNSFTRKCINSWNFFSLKFGTQLKELSRFELKKRLHDYFIDTY